jgi:hypothetical protein
MPGEYALRKVDICISVVEPEPETEPDPEPEPEPEPESEPETEPQLFRRNIAATPPWGPKKIFSFEDDNYKFFFFLKMCGESVADQRFCAAQSF